MGVNDVLDRSWLGHSLRDADAVSTRRSALVPATLRPPFEALPPVGEQVKGAIEREALRVNDRYVHEFLESYAFCPFAREGREAGETARHVYYADTLDIAPLLALMEQTAGATGQVVTQIILPLIDVTPVAWRAFCHALTELGHRCMGGPDVLAVAPFHPGLSFHANNPHALVPLFRRSPNPMIQWVRLDGLARLYEGREGHDTFVDLSALGSLDELLSQPQRKGLYQRVVETNASMARRLSIDTCVKLLAEIADDARRSYQKILLES